MNEIIKDYLYHLNSIEKKQRETQSFHFDFPDYSITTDNNKIIFRDDFFLKNRNIYINKHNRFADYPEHTHEFLEFNYMLAGSCTQIINHQEVLLEQGNLLLMDKGSSHNIRKLGEKDILINIIFRNKSMDLEWLTTLNQENSLIFDFLLKNLKENTENYYILFEAAANEHVQEILSRVIQEYFLGTGFVDNIISMYIPILLTELVSNTNYTQNGTTTAKKNDLLIVEVLKEIEKDFATISLEKVANELGYNKNYLSNTIKERTGQTFTQLLNKEKMRQAKFYLVNTSDTIEKITQTIGIQNRTYFYKLFEETYAMTPREYRQTLKNH